MLERRASTRFDLALPVHLGDFRGVTKNIGTDGALIVSPRHFPAGESIDIVFEATLADVPTRLACTALVRRVHRVGAQWALAVTFDVLNVLTDPPSNRSAQAGTQPEA